MRVSIIQKIPTEETLEEYYKDMGENVWTNCGTLLAFISRRIAH